METTGIVRRVDDLGRVVIPKEIRKTLKISEGDAVEIIAAGEEIKIKKYAPVSAFKETVMPVCRFLSESLDKTVLITDDEKVRYAYGKNSKIYIDKEITQEFKKAISGGVGAAYKADENGMVDIVKGAGDGVSAEAFMPISEGEKAAGAIVVISAKDEAFNSAELKTVKFAAELISSGIRF